MFTFIAENAKIPAVSHEYQRNQTRLTSTSGNISVNCSPGGVGLEVPPPPLPTSTAGLANHVAGDDVLKSEIMWTLNVVVNHFSYRSSSSCSDLFSKMFPDSAIASKFACKDRKCAYLSVFGVADHFQKILKASVQGPFVLLFDESLNCKLQEKQLDIHVRYFDKDIKQVNTRYFTSKYLGHATADVLLEKILECGLLLKDVMQLGMDGPNVNWKLHDNLSSELKNQYGTTLLQLGSCGLHVVHNSIKQGMCATDWEVQSFLSSLYYLLKDAPARLEDFIDATSSSSRPLKFVSHRWLENVPVAHRAISIYDNILKYVSAVENKKVPKPKCRSYEVVAACTKDVTFLAKLHFFKSVAIQLQPFLTLFQTDRPMVPFLSSALFKLMRTLMKRFLKKTVLDCQDEKLVAIDVKNESHHVNYRKIDIGFSSEKIMKELLVKKKVSDRMFMEFCIDCKTCLVTLVAKLNDKSPVAFPLVRHMSCLDPVLMASEKEKSCARFKKVLHCLVASNWVSEDQCDSLLQQFAQLLDSLPKDQFLAFQPSDSTSRLDTLLLEAVSGNGFDGLEKLLIKLLVLSHGQSQVERGFSVNKEIEVENMRQETLIAQRLICDHVRSVGGIDNIHLSNELLVSCKMAHSKYVAYLESERVKKKSAQEVNKRKATLEAVEMLKKKRRIIENDISHLESKSDQLLVKAETSKNIRQMVSEANALKKSASDKKQTLKLLSEEIEEKVKELTN